MHIVDSVIDSFQNEYTGFEMTDEGRINKYVGVKSKDIDENSFKTSQPFLVQHIIQFLNLYKKILEVEIVQLESLFSTRTLTLAHKNIHGYIVV